MYYIERKMRQNTNALTNYNNMEIAQTKKRRTPLDERVLPDYTKGEEIFNMVSHIVGGAMAIAILVLCIIMAATRGNAWGVVSSCIYGVSMIDLYCMSAIYHGLKKSKAKKVMQVLDHCTIYFLIAGTYTPVALVSLREHYPVIGWVVFGIVWSLCAIATTFTAIDLKKYSLFSNICYLGMGWCIIIFIKQTWLSIGPKAFFFILAGGIAYTVGAILYGLGTKIRYMHCVFHILIIVGSFLQFWAIIFYILPTH